MNHLTFVSGHAGYNPPAGLEGPRQTKRGETHDEFQHREGVFVGRTYRRHAPADGEDISKVSGGMMNRGEGSFGGGTALGGAGEQVWETWTSPFWHY